MRHAKIIWNPSTREWYCTICGRTVDEATERVVRENMAEYDCLFLYAETSGAHEQEQETVRQIRPTRTEPLIVLSRVAP